MICYAKLYLDIPINHIKAEVENFLSTPHWLPHYNKAAYTGNWEMLPLRTPGGGLKSACAELMGQESYADTALLQNLPGIKHLLNSLRCEKLSARLLNLRANAVIKQHRDYELAFEKGEARLHFPIFTNPLVEFYIDDKQVKMYEGECWYINANLPHRAANPGATDRIHLVVDCKVNPWLEQVFAEAEKDEMPEVVNRARQLAIIESLRLQQTVTAMALADKLEKELADGSSE